MVTPNTHAINKGGRPRKEGVLHKYIVPPAVEEIIKIYGIDYVWEAAVAYYRLLHPHG